MKSVYWFLVDKYLSEGVSFMEAIGRAHYETIGQDYYSALALYKPK